MTTVKRTKFDSDLTQFLNTNEIHVQPTGDSTDAEILDVLRDAKVLARRYYRLTGKPLGITGEMAEYEAATKLGLNLHCAR